MTSPDPLLVEFDGSVCPACHHRFHDPGGCSECPRCELHTDEALAFVLRVEPELVEQARLVGQWHGAIGSGPIEVLDAELGELAALAAQPVAGLDLAQRLHAERIGCEAHSGHPGAEDVRGVHREQARRLSEEPR